ncbi:hypothetical protein ABZ626_04075 [Streptomyces longispororuber]|uniref:hypothetical protein n=1 Tax=Streptomyces longispororuber TaxID=68230 RepID=UPI0033EE8534
MNDVTRRCVLGAAGGLAGAVALGGLMAPAAADSPPSRFGNASTKWRGSRSANGWEILDEAELHPIEGSGRSVRLAGGDAATLLLYVARRFHYEIDQLRAGDVSGHTTSRNVYEPYESNYLSGTAISIRPYAYPLGVRGGLYPQEQVVVRDILAELDGAVAWGGDLGTPKESHFEIALKPTHPKMKGVARKVRGWRDTPSMGAGATDAFDPKRLSTAKRFTRRNA